MRLPTQGRTESKDAGGSAHGPGSYSMLADYFRPLRIPLVFALIGGFGGLFAARALGRAAVEVTVLDRTNHHLFQPLLYQVASAGLSPGW